MTRLQVNGKEVSLDVDPSTPLLWALREELHLTGTKFGCGMAQCGACTVHVDGVPRRSCMTPVSSVAGRNVTTIEGLDSNLGRALVEAWTEIDVPQCGYCQSGQIMTAAGLLAQTPKPTDEQIDSAMNGTACRCGTYPRIRRAIHRASEMMTKGGAR